MGDRSLAQLIKQRRDALGFSQARLGELVGRSASTIRNWERGNATPSERSDAVALAAILGLNEREVLEGAGFEVDDVDEEPTMEQAYASLAPESQEAPSSEIEEVAGPEAPAEAEPGEERVDGVEANEVAGPPEDEPDSVEAEVVADGEVGETEPEDGVPEPEPEPEPEREPEAAFSEFFRPAPEVDLSDSTPAPDADDSHRVGRAAPPTVLETATPPEPSYLEDPGERQHYRVRAVATAALIIGLLIVLMWSFGRASDAFGTMWDQFVEMLEV